MKRMRRAGRALVAATVIAAMATTGCEEERSALAALEQEKATLAARKDALERQRDEVGREVIATNRGIEARRGERNERSEALAALYAAAFMLREVEPGRFADLDLDRARAAYGGFGLARVEAAGGVKAEVEGFLEEVLDEVRPCPDDGERGDQPPDVPPDHEECCEGPALRDVEEECVALLGWEEAAPAFTCSVLDGEKGAPSLSVCTAVQYVPRPPAAGLDLVDGWTTPLQREAGGSQHLRVRAAWLDGPEVRLADHPPPDDDPYRFVTGRGFDTCAEDVEEHNCIQRCDGPLECECPEDDDVDSEETGDPEDAEEEDGEDPAVAEAAREVESAAAALQEAERRLELERCTAACRAVGIDDRMDPDEPDDGERPTNEIRVTGVRRLGRWALVVETEVSDPGEGVGLSSLSILLADTRRYSGKGGKASPRVPISGLVEIASGTDGRLSRDYTTAWWVPGRDGRPLFAEKKAALRFWSAGWTDDEPALEELDAAAGCARAVTDELPALQALCAEATPPAAAPPADGVDGGAR